MTYDRFESVPVWKDAVELAVEVDRFVRMSPLKFDRDYTSQLRRAALSVSNNIAEGFERGTTQELLTFLYIARGSAGEVRSMMCVFERLGAYANFRLQISNLKSRSESVCRQLRGWADNLQNSPIAGQRRLTDQQRHLQRTQKEQAEFMKHIDDLVAGARQKEKESSSSNLKPQT